MTTTFLLIKTAIQKRQQVHAFYNGHYRELCPHVLGLKDGIEHCLFYQFGGNSQRGLSDNPNNNWRCLPLHQLENVLIKEGEWYSWSNYTIVQSCVDEVVAKLQI